MEQIIAGYASGVVTWLINFYNSTAFAVIKFIIGMYTVVIFTNIVLLLYQRGLSLNIAETRLGMAVPKEFVRKKAKLKLKKKWEGIVAKLETGDEAQYKVAIIEADKIIEKLIRDMAFVPPWLGTPYPEILDQINSGQIENIEDIKKSHLVRNRIIHEESFALTYDQAKEVLAPYEAFLRYHEVLD